GYYSSTARQVLRWPASDSGSLQVGSRSGGRINYRASLMKIRSLGKQSTGPVNNATKPARMTSDSVAGIFPFYNLPEQQPERLPIANGENQSARLSKKLLKIFGSAETSGPSASQLASVDAAGGIGGIIRIDEAGNSLELGAGTGALDWTFANVGNGLFRIQSSRGKRPGALAALSTTGVGFAVPGSDPRQLWRPVVHPRRGYVFAFENVFYPGYCLTQSGTGVFLSPFNWASGQFWLPILPPGPAFIQPLLRNFHTTITPNADLPPITVRLINSQPRHIEILMADLSQPAGSQRLRIAPRQSRQVTLQRDSGSTVTEYSEVLMWDGSWRTQEFTTQIPPRTLYDLSVYEVRLQSIAIDRTGKSPNVIEDVNYQPKSIGRFPIPPGDRISEGAAIDVFKLAQRAGNPGAVQRFTIEELENYELDPNELDIKLRGGTETKPQPPSGLRRRF
ncbi:MAG TPA: hypothetical protein DDW52_27960, partial [Planctomycetaceae bacterium]|nr:hypothetical protein [Planctomycetaceae bacterium]